MKTRFITENLKVIFSLFFQCGLRDLPLSLMRPPHRFEYRFEFETPGVDFTNILKAAFMSADPKSLKRLTD